MDTDDLSNKTYKAVLITAEKLSHNLTLQFGLLADECLDDDDYLTKANSLIVKWRANLTGNILYIFFDVAHPTPIKFEKVLLKIQQKIESVQNIPIEKRKFDFY